MRQYRCFPKTKNTEKEGIQIEMNRTCCVHEVNIGALADEDAPACVKKRAHVKKIEDSKSIEFKKETIYYKERSNENDGRNVIGGSFSTVFHVSHILTCFLFGY